MRKSLCALVLWLGAAHAAFARPATDTPPAIGSSPRPALLPGGEIFDQPTVLTFHVRLAGTNLTALREHPREYTPVTVVVNGQTFTNVGVKLKGAAGSFRSVDDHPAMTLHFSKWAEHRRCFGLRRLHLNNSVQDPSYLNEYLGSELFRAGGVPTPRVAWATVQINDRKLGLYVLKEAFEKEFLRSFFAHDSGNLYDGGFVSDIDQPLNRESGTGPDDRADLKALYNATQEKDRQRRWDRLQQVLDVDRFATYAALSMMFVDWDGYPLNRNNYRVYFRPDDGRAVFLPHGMDQLFQRSYLELDGSWNGVVAWSLFDIPQGQALYENRCREVFTNLFQLDRLTNAIARAAVALKPVLPDIDQRAENLADQIQSRYRNLRRDALLKPPPPPRIAAPAAPTNRLATASAATGPEGFRPNEWRRQADGNARLEGPVSSDGRRAFTIVAGNPSAPSWRGEVKLKAGQYRFEGWVRTADVQVLKDGKGEGAGLRISGVSAPRANKLVGTADWTALSYDFEVPSPEATITLVCELRASRGQAWFDADSLRVTPRP